VIGPRKPAGPLQPQHAKSMIAAERLADKQQTQNQMFSGLHTAGQNRGRRAFRSTSVPTSTATDDHEHPRTQIQGSAPTMDKLQVVAGCCLRLRITWLADTFLAPDWSRGGREGDRSWLGWGDVQEWQRRSAEGGSRDRCAAARDRGGGDGRRVRRGHHEPPLPGSLPVSIVPGQVWRKRRDWTPRCLSARSLSSSAKRRTGAVTRRATRWSRPGTDVTQTVVNRHERDEN
jgi:hypothetical protein